MPEEQTVEELDLTSQAILELAETVTSGLSHVAQAINELTMQMAYDHTTRQRWTV